MRIMTAHKKDYISMAEKRLVKFMVENNLLRIEAGGNRAEIAVYLKMDLLRVKFTDKSGNEKKIDVKIVNKKD